MFIMGKKVFPCRIFWTEKQVVDSGIWTEHWNCIVCLLARPGTWLFAFGLMAEPDILCNFYASPY